MALAHSRIGRRLLLKRLEFGLRFGNLPVGRIQFRCEQGGAPLARVLAREHLIRVPLGRKGLQPCHFALQRRPLRLELLRLLRRRVQRLLEARPRIQPIFCRNGSR